MVAILQPYIPHYREEFFNGIKQAFPTKIYCYEEEELARSNFKEANLDVSAIKSKSIGPFIFYDVRPLLKKNNDVLVLMLTFLHISTWFLLLTKPFHKKKIILWGHGISVKRYSKEEFKPNILLRLMIQLSDKTWFYTTSEENIWRKKLSHIDAVSLNNTVSNVEEIVNHHRINKGLEKEKLGIKQPTILIFCARFNQESRRADLLVQVIDQLDPDRFGFIIIGDGKLKPDFSKFPNVYDFGAVYEESLKSILFQISDIYFQPGWVGLSVVEAMAYGKPIFTFKRSSEILQCVEYSYIKHNINGLLFSDMHDCLQTIMNIDQNRISELSKNARQFTQANLRMEQMISVATDSIRDAVRGG